MVKLTIRQVQGLLEKMTEEELPYITLSTSSTGIVEAVNNFPVNHWIVANNGRLIDISNQV